MFDGPIGKIILFWMFMIGAMFFARVLGLTGDTKSTVIFMIACALVYVVWVIGRVMAAKRREEQDYMSNPRRGGRSAGGAGASGRSGGRNSGRRQR